MHIAAFLEKESLLLKKCSLQITVSLEDKIFP
jgi:hypothetical protein